MYDTSTDYDSDDEEPAGSNTGQTQSAAAATAAQQQVDFSSVATCLQFCGGHITNT